MHSAPLRQIPQRLQPLTTHLRFSLIVPMYNEAESVEALVHAVDEALGDYPAPWEFILVDDGSADASVKLARAALAKSRLNARLIELSRNYGQTAAMQAGIDEAKGAYIVTMDGDLQNDPRDIPEMLVQLETRDLDLLCGWRKDRQDDLVARKIPSRIANRLIGKVSGLRLHDYGCSLKVFRAEVIKQIKLVGEMHRFIPLWVAGVTPAARIDEIPVRHHARQFGQSKYGISRTMRVVLDLFSVMFFKRYLGRPGHVFGTLGLTIGMLGAMILAWLGVDKFILGNDIGTRPLFMVGVMCVLMSLQFLTSGLLAELMSRTYLSSDNSSNYLIRQIYTSDEGTLQ